MSLLIAVPNRDMTKLQILLSDALPEILIEIWPEIVDPLKVEFVLVWNPPKNLWCNLPNIKAISSFGAGVDGLIKNEPLPNAPVARIVDPKLADDMALYVLGQILNFKLRLNEFHVKQQKKLWQPKRAHQTSKVGILGLGQLGTKTAELLNLNGFEVSGWSRSEKKINNITCYHGDEGLIEMAKSSDYLVCLLPLTEQTKGILNYELFQHLPNHACIINVARGEHLIENDLLKALDNNEILGAILDVFQTEPLPKDHEFWLHPRIICTPHTSALTSINTIVEQIAENYQHMEKGEPLINLIDAKLGY
ncbi:glyoxylate/hydroxypyruvate reductase A [Pseudoalteromonas sp. NBT06-2]|uniref:2-hydroxyacid dehydrogenase n=1 Tax=Pseudoalteromonas sp. NBT06-2 TaxID=2025950 RepID=UPI000BA5E708|nr:glyoxylate/hydroxypyruvate reductase A [Pseudoalteromonas sp. NBT06-2]PAJ74841.1 glyoxylate/hydroxypyruvate reductase A [Pseudoalteromonas sp. NBT06-2]